MAADDNLALPKQILEMGPSYFKYILMKPTQKKISYIAAICFTALRITMVSLALRLLPEAKSLMVIVDVVSSASAFCQGLKSTVPIVFYKKELLWLTTKSSEFWPTDEETKSTESFYQRVIKVLLFYKYLIVVTYTAYVPAALFLGKLPFPTWCPSFAGSFYLMYTLQCIMLSFDAIIVCGSDSFFVGACLNIHAQFVILHNRLSNLGKKIQRQIDLDKEIVKCVKHHNFLLEYTNTLVNMYSIGLVFQFFVTTYSLCIELFIFTQRDIVGMIIGVIYSFMLTSQLGLYCFPADAVIEISQQCAEAVYSCPWFENGLDMKYAVINCIQRSHKRLIFTAGGLIDIDKRAFTKIFRGILSLNTLMRNILE